MSDAWVRAIAVLLMGLIGNSAYGAERARPALAASAWGGGGASTVSIAAAARLSFSGSQSS